MKPFLKLIAEDLYSKFGTNLSDTIVVFPSKRPEYYFYRYLSQVTKQNILAPKIATFDELIVEWSKCTVAGNLELVYHLYNVYQSVTTTNETFDQFYFWGEVMLADFDDIDKNLANPEKIFTDIKDLKNIEEMFIDDEVSQIVNNFWKTIYAYENSEIKNRFLQFWGNLLPVYKRYKKHLFEIKLAYKGLAYKTVYESIINKKLQIPHKQYIIAGFDTLSKSETEIFKLMRSENHTLFYWDYDETYLDNRFEAGKAIRDNLAQFPSALASTEYNNFKQKKNVTIAEAPGLTGIANIATQYALELGAVSTPDPDNTALILADQNLLFPTISALPKIENLNITLGWPAKQAEPALFLIHALEIWQTVTGKTSLSTISVSTIKKLTTHSWIDKSLSSTIDALCSGKMFVNSAELKIGTLLENIFSPTIDDIPQLCINILKYRQKQIIETEHDGVLNLELEIIDHLLAQFKQLSNVFAKFNIKLTPITQIRLIRQIINNLAIPFEGSPLSGLQITNLKETRCLDYNNIIIAGVNEGILPNNTINISHIPHSIRKAFNLPTFENNINKEAYYFYRCLQRAQKIIFISNSDEQEVEKPEFSRFVQQIMLEQPWDFTAKKSYNFSLTTKYPLPIENKWTERVEKYLNSYTTSENYGISPSAINTYIDCPLKFYLKYPAQLKEPNIATETMDPRVFGNLLHMTMEQLYTPFLNKEIQAIEFKTLLSSNKVEETVENVYLKTNEINTDSGYNFLFKNIVIEYVKQIIAIDAENAPIKILGLELPITGKVDIETSQGNKTVYIKGHIDRVDIKNGIIRILDYKTGNPLVNVDTNLDNLFNNTNQRKKEAFQAFFYTWLYAMKHKTENLPLSAGLIITRKAVGKEYSMFYSSGDKNNVILFNQIEDLFKEKVQTILSNMFNKDLLFSQTYNHDTCKICQYKQICQRQ